MTNLRKPYQMYVLNLDTSRIFWLTTLLILLLVISFFTGFLVGRVRSRSDETEVIRKNRMAVDQIINRIDNTKENDGEYQFYDLMTPKNENRTVRKDETEEKSAREPVPERSPEIKKEPASVPLMDSKPEGGTKATQ
ncbi:MAG: hypothetical protein PHF84_12405 [bacterium]|nr:hypothetical protein [bacterium]